MAKPRKISKGTERALAGAKKSKPDVIEEGTDVEEEPEEPEEVSNDEMLVTAIEGLSVVTVLRNGMTEKQIKLRLRISHQNRWKHMLTFLLREETRVRGDWNLHVCQHYLLYKDRLVYTWNFILQSDDLDNATRDICRMFDLIRSNLGLFEEKEDRVMRLGDNSGATAAVAKPAKRIFGELEEYPLMAPQDRNRLTSKGKGASLI